MTEIPLVFGFRISHSDRTQHLIVLKCKLQTSSRTTAHDRPRIRTCNHKPPGTRSNTHRHKMKHAPRDGLTEASPCLRGALTSCARRTDTSSLPCGPVKSNRTPETSRALALIRSKFLCGFRQCKLNRRHTANNVTQINDSNELLTFFMSKPYNFLSLPRSEYQELFHGQKSI